MRRPQILLSLALVAILSACGSSSTPGWTYAAPTAPPASQPAASGDASAPPASAPASEAPSGGASDMLTLTAQGTKWVQTELSAPADTAFTIRLDNQDNGMPHDLVVKDGTGAEVARSAVVTGVGTTDLAVPALAAGTYTYICSIHPSMTGTLTVG